MLSTNLLGPAWACHLAARHMAESGGGRIVNVSSRGAFRGEPDGPGYGAAKAGLNALGQSLAVALAPHGVTVLTLAPGFVETAMARPHLQAEAGDAIRAQSPFNRVATVDEVAYAVLFLASDEAAWGSGAILDFNGASYLRT
jgi:NAD(P)-dependent dehydrogenase (short-subunit alcohol dehydrogenase family)